MPQTFAVVTLQYGNLPYFPLSAEINRRYCEKHGYTWHVAGQAADLNGRHPAWSKIPAVIAMLQQPFTFVLFLDADAWFHDHAHSLERFVGYNVHPKTLITAGTDCRDAGYMWSDTDANTGTFLVRNTPLSRHIMTEWWHTADYNTRLRTAWPIEQTAFNQHIRPRWGGRKRIGIIPCRQMGGRDGIYIRHAVGQSTSARVVVLTAEHKRICRP